MGRAENKKRGIFKLFSQNLEWVKQDSAISFRPDFTNGYICPLCCGIFFEKDLDATLPNHLTLEDVPPVSLGGRPLTLTCKRCNSTSGHNLDAHLLNHLLENDIKSFLPNSKSEVSFALDGNEINGVIEVDKKGIVNLHFQPRRSNPKQTELFIKGIFPPRMFQGPILPLSQILETHSLETPSFQMRFKRNYNERRAEIALLRIAYLIAYATLGNAFLLNRGLNKVREQILNPDKAVLPKVFWLKTEFPEECEGINIITLPKELRSFLVVFKLKTASISRQFGIVLPGPSEPDIKVYDFIANTLCIDNGNENLTVVTEHLSVQDILRKKDLTFTSTMYWKEYTKDDYRPRIRPE